MSTTKKTYDHVVANGNHGNRFECLRCGEHYAPAMPVTFGVYIGSGTAFLKEHKGCAPHPEGDVCAVCGKRGHKPEQCPSAGGKS